ncbi:MAG: hypothetical protein ACLGIE_11280 [Alphaproteobacteria bacterium]
MIPAPRLLMLAGIIPAITGPLWAIPMIWWAAWMCREMKEE